MNFDNDSQTMTIEELVRAQMATVRSPETRTKAEVTLFFDLIQQLKQHIGSLQQQRIEVPTRMFSLFITADTLRAQIERSVLGMDQPLNLRA